MLQERSQQAAAEIDRLQRQLHEAALARVRQKGALFTPCMAPTGFQALGARSSQPAEVLPSCAACLERPLAVWPVHKAAVAAPSLQAAVGLVLLQGLLAQRNATLERLLSLRATAAAQHAVADAAADAAPTEEVRSELEASRFCTPLLCCCILRFRDLGCSGCTVLLCPVFLLLGGQHQQQHCVLARLS
jgi:hypothetical protein